MKKIQFGFANEKNPSGSWQGTGINSEIGLTDAEYYGAVKFQGKSYVVAKVTEDKYGHWPNLVGRFIVRPAVADIYSDNSGIIFLDQEQSLNGNRLENFLNNPQFKEKIHNLDDIVNFVKNGITKNNEPFDVCTISDIYVTTSIKHEEFEKIQKEAGIKEQLRKDRQQLSQHFSPEVVDEMLERRKKGLEELARLEEFSRKLKAPSDIKKYGYLTKDQVNEIIQKASQQDTVTQKVNHKQQLETPQTGEKQLVAEQSSTNKQNHPKSTLDLTQKEIIADQAKRALAQVVGIDFVNEHISDERSVSELNKELSDLQLQIYNLSDDMAIAMAKSCDRFKLEEARKQAYSNNIYDKPPYHREQYTDLFDYLNSQISKEAENVLLKYEDERKLDLEEAQEVVSEATNILENVSQEKSVYSPETQELLEVGEALLNQPELSPDYTIDQNLEVYTQLEQNINNNPNLSEEQKQAMRNALWADFDNFVEYNPEQGKQR